MAAALAHVAVEVAEVLGDRVVGDRRARLQEPGVLHRAPERDRIGLEHDRLDEAPDDVDVGRRELLHQPEVEERHPPAGPEQVVARVRVAVEEVQSVEAAGTRSGRSSRPRGPAASCDHVLRLGEARAVGELGGEHPTGAELGEHRRDVDERMTGVVVGELLLVRGLEPVVELLAEPGAQLVDERAGRRSPGNTLADAAEEQADVAEVGLDRLRDARVLHLHRDRDARRA